MIFFRDEFFTGLSRVQLGIDICSGFILIGKIRNQKIYLVCEKAIFSRIGNLPLGKKTYRQIRSFVMVFLFFANKIQNNSSNQESKIYFESFIFFPGEKN